jgi:Na+/H+ antiporter NhaD/arsenite permease-like protein
VVLFVIALILFVIFERWRVVIAAVGALVALATGLVSVSSLFPTTSTGEGSVVAWNTIALLAGLFLFASLLRELQFFRWVAIEIARRTENRPVALFASLAGLTFVLAAFVNSIAVMIVIVAITIEVARAVGYNPVPFVLGEISAANAGGTATLYGNPPNLILGTYFQLSFTDFLMHTAPAAVAVLAVILLLFSRRLPRTGPEHPPQPPEPPTLPKARLVLALVVFAAMIGVLVGQANLGVPIWAIGVGGGVAALLISLPGYTRSVVRRFDYETLLFLVFLFVLVGALVQTGAIDNLASAIATVGGTSVIVTGVLLLWVLGLMSAFVDSVPLAAAAAPLISALGATTGVPTTPLVYATALGTDIGGNGSPIGAGANIVGLAEARRDGYPVGWRRYLRDAFPVMVASLAAATIVWLFVH